MCHRGMTLIESLAARKDRCRAFTLIELVVVMVVVSLLLGLLLPALARTREEEAKAQCRNNLRYLGLAIVMYSGDNGGWAPEIGGNIAAVRKTKDPIYYDPIFSPQSAGFTAGGADYYGLMHPQHTVSHNNLTVGQPQHWQCSPQKPSRAVNLGLLWTGGYTGKKGAELFYCPANESVSEVKQGKYDLHQRYDADEPFWTSKGLVMRGDRDGTGDPGTDWNGARAPNDHSCYDGTRTIKEAGTCNVLTNYSVRLMKKFCKRVQYDLSWSSVFPAALKLEETGKAGILSDNLELWLGQARPKMPLPPERYVHARRCLITNHDNAYNILFSDGHVRTFEDTSRQVFKNVMDHWFDQYGGGTAKWSSISLYVRNTPMGEGVRAVTWPIIDELVFKPILDKAY